MRQATPDVRETPLAFADLDGWAADDHDAALAAWAVTAGDVRPYPSEDARAFFERAFRPVLIEASAPALFTGYYEPVLDGALTRSERFATPLYGLPPGDGPWPDRTAIEEGALAGWGLEIAWVEDPVEAFFLQVQGSGRLRLPDGSTLRLGYAGRNAHPYTSIGRAMMKRGVVAVDQASAEELKAWLRGHPREARDILRLNASFVFFRVLDLPPDTCPLGTMGQPVTAGRSVAVDPDFVPLGAPVWIETDGPEGLRRLVVAQDTGGAIRGAQRADLFLGTGPDAGMRAGRLREGGRMVVRRTTTEPAA